MNADQRTYDQQQRDELIRLQQQLLVRTNQIRTTVNAITVIMVLIVLFGLAINIS